MKFEFYSAEGRFGQIDEIAARVLETSPDAILAAGANEVAHAFKRLTRTVPIIMANSSDPDVQGLVNGEISASGQPRNTADSIGANACRTIGGRRRYDEVRSLRGLRLGLRRAF
jgi:hypothetical protein